MNKKFIAALLGAAALAASSVASAQWYAGGEIGRSDVGSEDDTSFKFLGGFQVNRHFAAEAGYGFLFDKNGSEAKALEVVGVGLYPLGNQFSVLGKIGLANVDVKTPGGSDDSTELTYGFGGQYDATPKLGIRLQWQRYDTDNEIDVISIGAIYRF